MLDLCKAVTQNEFGEMVGIGQSAVADLVRRGVLHPGDSASTWLLAYCERLRAVAAGRVDAPELTAERTRRERLRGDRDELRLAQERGKLAEVEPMLQAVTSCTVTAREALLALPDRTAARLAAESDTARVHAILTEEIERTIKGLQASITRVIELRPLE